MHNLMKTIQTLHLMKNPEAIKLMIEILERKQQAEQRQAEQQLVQQQLVQQQQLQLQQLQLQQPLQQLQKLRILDHLKCVFGHVPRMETEEHLLPLITDKEEFVSDVHTIICAFSNSAMNPCLKKNKQQQQEQEPLVGTNLKDKSLPNSKIPEPIVAVHDHQDMLVSENNSKKRKDLWIPSVSMPSNDSTRKRKRRDTNNSTTSSLSNLSSSLSSLRKYEEDEDHQGLLEQEVTLILSDKKKKTTHGIISSSSSSYSSSGCNLQEESTRNQSFKKSRLLTMRYNQEREDDANLLLSLSFVPSRQHDSTNSD